MELTNIKCYCKANSEPNTTCTMGTTQCCWCMDKRTVYKIYIDGYGLIEPGKYYSLMPRDLYYCSKCKYSDTISVGCYTEELKKILPEPNIFHEQVTRVKKTNKIKLLRHKEIEYRKMCLIKK